MSFPTSAFLKRIAILLTLLAGCAPADGGQTGSELSCTTTEDCVDALGTGYICGASNTCSLDGSQGNSPISIADSELVVERRISGDSPFWGQAPYLVEGPFACPIPLEALTYRLSQAHEVFVIHNEGSTRSLEIRLEGSSFDSELTADPLLFVYPGSEMPDEAAEVSACLGLAKRGAVTVSVESGQSVLAIALELEISQTGFEGGAGTFRLRVVP